jgi:hypothetical protein
MEKLTSALTLAEGGNVASPQSILSPMVRVFDLE